MPKFPCFLASTHSTSNLIGPSPCNARTEHTKIPTRHTLGPLTYKLLFQNSSTVLHIVMFSFSVVFDSLQKVSVTPLKSFEAFSIRDWLNQWTVRVKGGMNLLSGMWHGLRNDIIMRNLIYRKWRKKKNSTGKHARYFWRQFERAIDLLVHLLLLLKQG